MEELIPKSAEIPNSDFVIIGGTGDLAFRKIYPALFWRFISGQINKEFRIFSIARSFQEKDQFSKMNYDQKELFALDLVPESGDITHCQWNHQRRLP